MIRKEVLIILFLVVLISFSSSLGVSPAIKKYNFEPGLSDEIEYRVFGVSDKEIELSVTGNLSKYVELSKTELKGDGNFRVKLNLPDTIAEPGRHRIGIVISEKHDEELKVLVSTSIKLISAIDVYVPYPGRYLDVNLEGDNANAGEPIEFVLGIQSQGDEEVNVIPRIEISSLGRKVEDLIFNPRTILSQDYIELKKVLDTTDYNPGNYKATAIVDYGIPATSEFYFRIGELNIDILNYTSAIPLGDKLEPFEIAIESSWNDEIDGVFAEIYFSQNGTQVESVKTTSTSLIPWENKVITGYVDTNKFSEGSYRAEIILSYFGKSVGKTSKRSVDVLFYEAPSLLIWYLVGGIGVLLFVIVLLIKLLWRKNDKRRKKRKK